MFDILFNDTEIPPVPRECIERFRDAPGYCEDILKEDYPWDAYAVTASVTAVCTEENTPCSSACSDFSMKNLPLSSVKSDKQDTLTGYEYYTLVFDDFEQVGHELHDRSLVAKVQKNSDGTDVSLSGATLHELIESESMRYDGSARVENAYSMERYLHIGKLEGDFKPVHAGDDNKLVLTSTSDSAKCTVTVTLERVPAAK
ncbi:hypothetical protein ANAPC1_00273 [Anaplasma phagocytophilum]|uniref:Uncharacterized protein n=1 Tax=Anaplasma phagocytophilum TaxID=948 RepID=A0AA45ZH69_ANAPH|nr:hypothetical protein [Anaplasma phagocytophilum]SBO13933.1 hypothetical protein ANAPC1_00273 [Anaplasma phagocytophilum]